MLSLINIEDYLRFYCAPCLLRQKCACLFSIPISRHSEGMDRIDKLKKHGFVLRLIYTLNKKAYFLLYSNEQILKRLNRRDVKEAFSFFGYKGNICAERIMAELFFRLVEFSKGICDKSSITFPHEIGLFLGYPPQDVLQYYIKNGQGYIFSGYWKVYTNPSWARCQFKKYDRARAYCLNASNLPCVC